MELQVPKIGLGTWENDDHQQCARTVETALEMGYRHIDTAQYYGNEAAVGEGLAAADVPREDVFLATKVHPFVRGLAAEEVFEGVEESLGRLGVEYIDLLYVHWPSGNYDAEETLGAFDELVDRGTVEHVGVSNFDVDLVAEARSVLDAPLSANQIELHPFLPQTELVADARRHGYRVVAYSPLARGEALTHPTVEAVAERRGATPAQVCLAWVTRHEHVAAVPKATGRRHLRDNLRARDLDLEPDDVAAIDDIDRRVEFFEQSTAENE